MPLLDESSVSKSQENNFYERDNRNQERTDFIGVPVFWE